MNDPEVDPQRLAALLDGRLDEEERRATLEQLMASDDGLALYADVAAVLGELDDEAPAAGALATTPAVPRRSEPVVDRPARPPETAGATVLPIDARPRVRTARRVPWLAIAASIAVLALVPAVWLRARTAEGVPAYVASLAAPDAGLPTNWNGTPWPTTRGAGDPLTPEARAIRVGARLADLELLARTRDPRAAETATEIVALLEEQPGAGAAAASIEPLHERLRRGAVVEPGMIAGARVAATAAVGDEAAAVGMWLEAARVAAARRDAEFFRHRESRAALEGARGSQVVRSVSPEAIVRLEQLLDPDRSLAWDQIQRELTNLLAALGR